MHRTVVKIRDKTATVSFAMSMSGTLFLSLVDTTQSVNPASSSYLGKPALTAKNKSKIL